MKSDKKYILAISGGIDSVVLLEKVARGEILLDAEFPRDFIVAHFDHGMRGAESARDAEFVRSLTAKYDTEFILGEESLSFDCSEDLARERRYDFFEKIIEDLDELNSKIVTAHHQNDLIETIVMNLIRGTGWRGLAPMSKNISRPLLNMTKIEIVDYAIENNLDWVEDATNFLPNYFRNRIRSFTDSFSNEINQKFLELYFAQKNLRDQIDQEVSENLSLSRYFLIMTPEMVAIEILRMATNGELTRPQLDQVLLFTKTSAQGKKLKFKNIEIMATKHDIAVTKKAFV